MTHDYKLGKTPARKGAVKLKFINFLHHLPPVPAVFGHEGLLPTDVGMLGNDQYGDCVWAGAAHETILWNTEAQHAVTFDEQSVLADYTAVTGFNPQDPTTDTGTDVQAAASYRRTTGILDSRGQRHRVAAYVALDSVGEVATAAYLFGAVGVGIRVPSSAQTQFEAGQPWDVVAGDTIEGGHYVSLVGRNARGNYVVITWGRTQEVTPAFLRTYLDEAIAYISEEALVGGKSPEGFNIAQLRQDLANLA
jgi:hypothetical protein